MIDPKQLRQALGMILAQVGAELKVSHTTVSGWESRRRTPAADQALKWARALGVPDAKLGAFLSWWGEPNG